MDSSKLIRGIRLADKIVRTLIMVKPGENVMIVADTETEPELTYSLFGTVRSVGAEPTMLMMHSTEPEELDKDITKPIQRAIEGTDVYIPATRTTGKAIMNPAVALALKNKKIRVLSLVRRTIDRMTTGAGTADYEKLYELTKNLAKILEAGKRVRVTSNEGTDVTFSIEQRHCKADAGYSRNPGDLAAFPDGEACLGPVEGTAEGTIVIDGPVMAVCGMPREPIKLTVKRGRVVGFSGGKEADKLRAVVTTTTNADNIGEFGIGTNPKAMIIDDVQETKKGLGRVHFALGDGTVFGGTLESPVHLDAVILKPRIEIDGRLIDVDERLAK